MTNAPAQDYSNAVGRTQRQTAIIETDKAAALAATLDLDDAPASGSPLPPGWHWLYFNPFVKQRDIGSDGHPKRGGFLPDIQLPRRMWAGGRLTYHSPLIVGAPADKESEIIKVTEKSGKSGQLVFVTLRHRLLQNNILAIEEEQDIVFRAAPPAGAPRPTPAPAPETGTSTQLITPNPVLLFRFSALTSNGHRIHYDRTYAQQEEGYHDLVVHGPLTATLLQGFAQNCRPDARLTQFNFRGMAPLFGDRPFSLEANPAADANKIDVWARGPDGALAMQASAEFSD
ncbi:MAG: MaoC family dehydratase N-terminal domain-containing protein [Rhodobacteraceae bacterium]|nr:MaoC family dehydratase N-terminal domain-containing protein [Paracoccaceae bacterium]PHR54053.1 MAG: acyl-CoA dehydrogenase [Robiginitomaculum sp.]